MSKDNPGLLCRLQQERLPTPRCVPRRPNCRSRPGPSAAAPGWAGGTASCPPPRARRTRGRPSPSRDTRPPASRRHAQHAVIRLQCIGAHRLRLADRAVVRVMEQQGEPPTPRPQCAECSHQGGLVPLVDNDQIGAVARLRQIDAGLEHLRHQVGIGLAERRQRVRAMIGEQVGQAPGPAWLVRHHVMASPGQFAQHAAQEMRVAVVPARQQRVREVDDPQASALAVCRAGQRLL